MVDENSIVLGYTNDDSDYSSDEVVGSSSEFSKEPTNFVDKSSEGEEYEEDDIKPVVKSINKNNSQYFEPLLNVNIFIIDEKNDEILLGLNKKQILYISGIFKLEILKGGIVYNNNHYDASFEKYSFWHPSISAIPFIQSSYFSGWKEYINKEERYQDIIENDLKNYSCIIKIYNCNSGLVFGASKLFSASNKLWNNLNLKNAFTSQQSTYSLLTESTEFFKKLKLSSQWVSSIEEITRYCKEAKTGIRILTLGGKNSGKSTYLRVLVEHLKLSLNKKQNVLYFDTDPGQPEYSDPECVSLCKIPINSKTLGNTLGQDYIDIVEQIYLGSSSPQDFPSKYLTSIEKLLEVYQQKFDNNSSVINLPGWIKGFGLIVTNFIITKYKPTHIIMLETASSKDNLDELNIPTEFVDNNGNSFQPYIYKLDAHVQEPVKDPNNQVPASQIRIFKLLTYFHKHSFGSQINYDFTQLAFKSPMQISYGKHGIRGFGFLEEFSNLNETDIKNTLEGTIVALHCTSSSVESSILQKATFPIINGKIDGLKYITLALIHSIDVSNKLINIYIPIHRKNLVISSADKTLLLLRRKTETPIQELDINVRKYDDTERPFLTTQPRKRYEHVWKVRKNIKRRGHHMK